LITGAVITAVSVRGAYTAQRALEAGVLGEVQIHQIPVLLGQGRRLFDELPSRSSWRSSG
jgi:dihydrofolate reductase